MNNESRELKQKYSNIIKAIVKKDGGYREKELLKNKHLFVKGGTWNEKHKTIDVLESEPGIDGYYDGFQIDLVTKSITG